MGFLKGLLLKGIVAKLLKFGGVVLAHQLVLLATSWVVQWVKKYLKSK